MKKNTKRSLLFSVLALILCCALLAGTTLAWFTDTASTAVNKIQAGNLDVQLLNADGTDTVEGQNLSFVKPDGVTEQVLWEPGVTYYTEGFQIKNNGNLALKFKIEIAGITTGNAKLLEVIDFYLTATKPTSNAIPGDAVSVGALAEYYPLAAGQYWNGTNAGSETPATVYLVGHMQETAGNEYQNKYIDGVGITLYATQVPAEFDSFSDDYDSAATWPVEIVQPVTNQAMTKETDGNGNPTQYTYTNSAATVKATVPAAAVTGTEAPAITVKPTQVLDTVNTIIKPDGKDAIAYDIDVTGLATDNTIPVTVSVFVGKNLEGVVVYHHEEKMTTGATYNPTTGFVTITTTSFGPFTIAYDAPKLNQDADGNFTIGSVNELLTFAKEVNEKGNTFAGKTVKLMADIDLAGKKWIPVGQTQVSSFQGTFDGQNHTIKNMTVNYTGTNTNYACGLFGWIELHNGSPIVIQNVEFDNANVTGIKYTGVVAGYANGASGAKIKNCTVANSTVVSNTKNAGGIIGYMGKGVLTDNTVSGCTISAKFDVGGIANSVEPAVTFQNNRVENTNIYYAEDQTYNAAGIFVCGKVSGVTIVRNNTSSNVTVSKQVTVSTANELSNALKDTYNANTVIKLANDITLSGEWGAHALSASNSAKLTIDGNNKTIYGLYSSEYHKLGGFNSNGLVTTIGASFSSVTFKNLTVSGANLTNNGGDSAATGVFVGDTNTVNVAFENCTVTDATVNCDKWAGGFVGFTQDVYNNKTMTFTNCVVSNSEIKTTDSSVGGLVGHNYTGLTIRDCQITGNTSIACAEKRTGMSAKAGYLVGTVSGGTTTISNITVESTVQLDTKDGTTYDTTKYVGRTDGSGTVSGVTANS